MKTKTQLFIDKFMAKPLAWVFNFITRLAGAILRIDHSLDKKFKKIAVCKFKGMGSIIQATPLLTALREMYPDAQITFVSTRANLSILQMIKTIDSVITLDDKNTTRLLKTFWTSIIRLIKIRPDVYIDLEIYSNFSTIFTLLTLSKNRLGYYLRSSNYRMGIYTHMMFFNPRVPISEVYLQMARVMGFRGQSPSLFLLCNQISTSLPLPTKTYILINPNASDLRIERRWSQQNFIILIDQLIQKYPNFEVVLIGSRSEFPYVNEICRAIRSDKLHNFAGQTTIQELIGLVANACFVITNDTGPMHIAFSCNVPTLCLFGPCAPEQYGNHENAYIIYHKVFCSPCVHDFEIPPCKGDNICMQKITIDEVMETVNQIMQKHHRTTPASQTTHYYHNNITLGLIKR